MAKQLYYNNNIIKNKKKDSLKWLPALQLFEMALKLCKISATEEREVEAEILFQKGKLYLGSKLWKSLWFFFLLTIGFLKIWLLNIKNRFLQRA